jgi:hypothetical protein
MKCKVKHKMVETPKIEYPYLGVVEHNGRIVLFTAKSTGVQVNDVEGELGRSTHYWAEDDFKLFHGEVILSND